MRVLVQRVSEARVSVAGRVIGEIGPGLLLLVGMGAEDGTDNGAALAPLAAKIGQLRIMADETGRMNRSIDETGGALLVVSQFTLHADCRHGRRPGFTRAAPPEVARELFERFVALLQKEGRRVATGEFGAMMHVLLVNDGPVTIWLDSEELLK